MGRAVEPVAGRPSRTSLAALAPRLALLFVFAGYLAAGLYYNTLNPIWETPDEPAHLEHVLYIADYHELPVRQIKVGDQLHQPPLYYLIGSLVVSAFNLDDDLPIKSNPNFIWREEHLGQEPNLALHTLDELPPYKGTVLAVHALRFLSLLFCAVAVGATYVLARRVVPSRPWLAVAAAAATAFNPQFLFVSASLGNDGPAIAMGSLTTLTTVELALRVHRGDRVPLWLFLALGAWIGLGMLSKLTFYGVVPMVAIAGVYTLASARGRRRQILGGWLAAGFLALALGGWWYVRNLLVYRSTFAIAGAGRFDPRTMVEIQEKPEQMAQILAWYPEPLFQSFWLRFGWMTVYPERWVYDLAIAACLLAVAGFGIHVLLRYLRKGLAAGDTTLGLFFCALTLLSTIAITTWRFAYTIGNHYPQGRYLFPAQPATSLLLVLGLATLAGLPLVVVRGRSRGPRRGQSLGTLLGAVTAIAFALALGVGGVAAADRYIAPNYRTLPIWLRFDPSQAPNPMQAEFAAGASLIGFAVDRTSLSPGDSLTLDLYWRAERGVTVPLQAFVHVADEAGRPVAQKDAPAGGEYAITRWQRGEVVRDRRTVPVGADVVPGTYRIFVGLYSLQTMERVPLSQPAGATAAPLGAVEIVSR